MPIIKKYKNQLTHFLIENNFDVHSYNIFDCTESNPYENYEALSIMHKMYEYVFVIFNSRFDYNKFSYYYTQFKPGNPNSDYCPTNGFCNFEEILLALKRWIDEDLNSLLEEEGPDLLQVLINNSQNFSVEQIDFTSDELFSQKEQNLLKQGMDEIKGLISERMNLTIAELAIVNDRIGYLSEGVERLSKTDWKGIVISTVIGIITTLSLDSEKGKMLWDLFLNVINNLPQISN